jgi:formylglycine-generating enzyme required for sulfatase activity
VPDKAAIQGRIDSCKQHAKAEDDKAATHQADNDVWELVRESTDPKVIRKYLERHPGTRHKAVALARIAALEKVDEVVKSADTPVDKVPLPIKKVPALEIIEPAMVHVPGGRFKMGSNDYDNEKPIHDVELKEFWIGKYLVTVGEYLRFADDTKSHFPVWLERDNEYNVETGSKDYYKSLGFSRSADNFPIVGVSWEDARIYCEWLSNKTGKRYRLPTEAEWEYAARGGHKSKHYKYSGSNSIKEVAWYAENGSSKPQPVGKKKANELGLFDMSGNVWEWCGDWYGEYPSEPQINPTGPGSGSSRVYRGGSWHDYADYCRVSHRFHHTPGRRNSYLGFRIVLSFH